MVGISVVEISRGLKGIIFPADKRKLINTAKFNGTPDNIMQYFNRLPERQYNRVNDVQSEISRLRT